MNKTIIDYLSAIANVILILGLPIAVIQYISTTKKEKKDREYETYNSLDEKYVEWEKLCLEYPQLDIYDVKDSIPPVLNAKEKKEEMILFTILFSIFERAYILYSDESTQMKKDQWIGWHLYITNYCQRDNFRQAWRVTGATFDDRFQKYMKENMEKNAK
ncbi:MAG: hypothetical protein Q8941_22905 [Bacteroidota bacterium]|nr:hypothetical protein [Bacteroidota bacterium]